MKSKFGFVFCGLAVLGAVSCMPPRRVVSTGAPTSPTLPSATSSAILSSAERCGRGDLTLCAELAVVRTKSIREGDNAAGLRELRSLCDRGLADACASWGEWATSTATPAEVRTAFERGCSLGAPRSCAFLGFALDWTNHEAKRASELLNKACSAGSPEGCIGVAEMMRPAEWTPELAGTFWGLMTRACEGKMPRACRQLGLRELRGLGVARDAVSAASRFAVACAGRDAEGCTQLGIAQLSGNGTTKDEKEGARSLSIGCDQGDMEGCRQLAHAYARGLGVTKDVGRATKLLSRACSSGIYSACAALLRDEELEPDRSKRLALLGALCDAKAPIACHALGDVLAWTEGERPRALAKLEDACSAKVLDACVSGFWTSTRVETKPKPPAKKPPKARRDVKGALSFLERGCDMADPTFACVTLADQLSSGEFVARDEKRAAELAFKLCDVEVAGRAIACRISGDAHLRGFAGKSDPALAAAAYVKACDGGNAEACRALAGLARTGRGVPKDAARAKALEEKAKEADIGEDD